MLEPIIKFKDGIISEGDKSIGPFSLEINKGDVCEVQALNDAEASLFLKGMATMSKIRGEFFFKGKKFNTCDYKNLLEVKRYIAYLGTDCSLLSNRSVLENIHLAELWEKDIDEISPDESFLEECEEAGILDYLNLRPDKMPDEAKCGVYILRELKKNPEIILLERPYLFTRGRLDMILRSKIGETYAKKVPVVVASSSGFIPYNEITHIIRIKDNHIEKIPR
jgi:ABC-type lipoprotein export system ATPase subunit